MKLAVQKWPIYLSTFHAPKPLGVAGSSLRTGLASEAHRGPLIILGNANYDYHRLGELIPELRSAASPVDQAIVYAKHVFADRIADQYRGLQQIIAMKNIDLVMTDVLFFGELPLLLSGESRPPVIACGVIAPSWIDPAFSIFTGPDGAPGGRARNIADNETFESMRAPGYKYIDAVLDRLGVTISGGFTLNNLYHLPDVFLQLGTEAFEYPMEDRPTNLVYTGPILHRDSDTETPAWMDRLDRSLPVVLVSQGTLANFDFDQLVNPALLGLADEPVQVVVTAGAAKTERSCRRRMPSSSPTFLMNRSSPGRASSSQTAGTTVYSRRLAMAFPSPATERAKINRLYRLVWVGVVQASH
jgi:hypothetical protein